MSTRRDLIIEQGASWSELLTWKTGDLQVPVDLTGFTAKLQIRPDSFSPLVLAEIVPTLGGQAGTISYGLTAAETAALSFDSALYDLTLTQGPVVYRLTYGNVSLSRGVTR